jgi:heat shock protein HtpX
MKNQLKTILLLGALSAVLIAIGGALGQTAFIALTAVAVAMNIGAYFFSDRLVLRMNNARELAHGELPWLRTMVQDLARRARIPEPRLYVIEDPHANAFATGRNPEKGVVAVTTGLLRTLNERELRGVIAHEIAHIQNRDILVASVAAAIAAAVSLIGNVVQWGALFGGGQREDGEGSAAGGLVMAFVAPIAATMVQLGISRSREYLADETAAHLTGDAEGLASALATLSRRAELVPGQVAPATASLYIVAPFAGASGLLNLFSTHPPMDQRIARLRALHLRPTGRMPVAV